jgi:hypothetical protein
MSLSVIAISVLLLGLGVLGMAITIVLKKDGKFPDTEVSHNENMRKLGITCEKCDEMKSCQPKIEERKEKRDNYLQQLDEILKL